MLSVGEKSQVQALDRIQPGLPHNSGKCATHTHVYVRHDAVRDAEHVGGHRGRPLRAMSRHEKLIAFFDQIENPVPAGKVVHAVMDNHGTHKHPEVMAWLADNPRWTFHFTPTSCSWLDAGDALSPS